MTFITSDIHGDFEKYQKLLNKINLNENDQLIILGDVFDRGNFGIKIMLDIINRKNVSMLMGNHEEIALKCLKILNSEVSAVGILNLEENAKNNIIQWFFNLDGQVTFDEFSKLEQIEKQLILNYIEKLPLYKSLKINKQDYLLVHGALGNFHPDKTLENYSSKELLWDKMDYAFKYFEDIILISGHTPTSKIDNNPKPNFIYKDFNHIAVDCGCGFSKGKLGCICLETMEEFYI